MKSVITLLAFVCFLSSAMAQNSADLKFNLDKNKVYHLKSVSNQNISQTMQGMQQTTTVKSSTYASLKLMETTPEFMVAEVKFDSIITNTNAMGREIVMNSALPGDINSQDPGQIMTFVMNRFCSTPMYAKLNYDGKVIEIINLNLISANTLKDLDSIKGQAAPMLKNQVKSMVDSKAVQTMVESLTSYLPGKVVNVGGSWEKSLTTTTNGLSMLINNKYKLNSIQGNVANVDTESSVEPASSDPVDMNGAKITNNLRGLSKGQMTIDTKTGLIIKSTGKIHMEGNMGVDVPGNSFSIPMQIDGETTVEAL